MSWRCRVYKRRAITFFPAGIESKLRDDQDLAACSQQRKIHLTLLIFEDAKVLNLFRKEIGVRLIIMSTHTSKMHMPDCISPTMLSPAVTWPFVTLWMTARTIPLLTQEDYATTVADF